VEVFSSAEVNFGSDNMLFEELFALSFGSAKSSGAFGVLWFIACWVSVG
jgi:hypothetical protein